MRKGLNVFKITKIMSLFFITVFILIGLDRVIQWGYALDQVNQWLDVVLYVFILAVLANYLLLPWLKWASKPKLSDLKEWMVSDPKKLVKFARNLASDMEKTELKEELERQIARKDHEGIRKSLELYYDQKFKAIETYIGESGKRVFSLTALSQNSLIDGLIILVINLNMLYRIYEKLGLRESYIEIFKFYNATFMQASFMSLLEEFDDELLEVLQSKSTELLKKVPFAEVLFTSILQGVANGYATSYYGYLTVSNFRKEVFEDNEISVRKYARQKARANILDMAKQSINTLTDYSKRKMNVFKWNKNSEFEQPME